MKEVIKIISLVLTTISSFILSYKVCYLVGEKYFFDRLFYQKSIKHGYLKTKNLTSFGVRAQDVIPLTRWGPKEDPSKNSKVLGTEDEDQFTIALVGDSFTWGMGVKNNERFATLLEKKLNKIRKTRVLSFALPGDNFIDHFSKVESIKNSPQYNINLWVFAITINDILIDSEILSDEMSYADQNQETNNLFERCLIKDNNPSYDIKANKNDPGSYVSHIGTAWENPANLCILEECLSTFPQNSIYFLTDDYYDSTLFKRYKNYLRKYNLFFVSGSKGKEIKKYQKYWKGSDSNFTISKSEGHASKIAHRMYADILFKEIAVNPKWGFVKDGYVEKIKINAQ